LELLGIGDFLGALVVKSGCNAFAIIAIPVPKFQENRGNL
jgi:hypothetical protein